MIVRPQPTPAPEDGAPPPVYLDHLATTPLDPLVADAMRPWLAASAVGNPHSAHHAAGWRAAEAVEQARALVADLLGARPGEIAFTSGATEANNLALFGAAPEGGLVITTAIEHPSIRDCLPPLRERGCETTELPVGASGRVAPADLSAALGARPALVSVMAANNETGVIQPLAEIGEICRAQGTIFHSDATQLLSTQTCNVHALGLDLLSLSGHKLYGPMGIGALYVRDGLDMQPMLYGGAQQHGLRPGTLPVAQCVGLGEACRLAKHHAAAEASRLRPLRERLFARLSETLPELRRNGGPDDCLPGCLNVTIPGIDAANMLLDLPELALSTGSACASGKPGPSHVLLAMGLSPKEAHGSVRFGLGRATGEAEVNLAVARIADWAARQR